MNWLRTWLRWALGRGEYVPFGKRNIAVKPEEVPAWWLPWL